MTHPLFDVSSLNVLITGSSRGLGFTFAEGLGSAGARVILNGRNRDALEGSSARLREKGIQVYAYTFDILDPEGVHEAVGLIEKEVGPLDVLVNNAGVNIRAPLEDFGRDDWDRVIGINLGGAFHAGQAVARHMIPRRRGKIINICSLQSELGRSTIAPYAAAKGGLKMLTRGMAVEWAKYNIQVNGIGPGYFKTDMTKPLYENPEFDRWLCSRTPANRWGEPEELLGVLFFLCSAASSYVNGQVIYVDGGLLAGI